MQSLWGSTSLITISTPPPHQKGFADICRILQGFCFFLKVWVYFEERNHAVKHGVKLLGTAFTFQKHANMHSLWGSTSLITITTPPHHIHFGGRNHAVHGEICLEIALPSQNHANMQSLWGSTSLITISPPPHHTEKDLQDFARFLPPLEESIVLWETDRSVKHCKRCNLLGNTFTFSIWC